MSHAIPARSQQVVGKQLPNVPPNVAAVSTACDCANHIWSMFHVFARVHPRAWLTCHAQVEGHLRRVFASTCRAYMMSCYHGWDDHAVESPLKDSSFPGAIWLED
eukprot:365441-Chlamydomonas_euryale.AAC.7